MPLSFNNYVEEFSRYIASGDAVALSPYLAEGANLDYLRIYRNGAIKACIEALAANFPTLKRYLGEDAFKALGRQYVLHQWPQDSRLSTYGDRLAEFIGADAAQYPLYGEDMAKLDRAWLDALFSAYVPSLSSADVAGLMNQDDGGGRGSIELASTVRVINLDHGCLHLWIKLKFSTDEDEEDEKASRVIMMWRHETKVHYRQLNKFEQSFVSAVAESGSIMAAAESAVAENPGKDPGREISTLFAGLLTAGILAKSNH